MAAADITLTGKWATIECDTVDRKIELVNSGFLAHKSGDPVFITLGSEAVDTADVQKDGVIKLEPGDTLPLPDGAARVNRKCASGTAVLWFVPNLV